MSLTRSSDRPVETGEMAGVASKGVLVLTREVRWTGSLAHAGFGRFQLLELSEPRFDEVDANLSYDLVVLQVGAVDSVTLHVWLKLGQSVLNHSGLLALDLLHTSLIGPDNSDTDAGANLVGWTATSSEEMGDAALLMVKLADNQAGVPLGDVLTMVGEAARAVQRVVETSAYGQMELQEDALRRVRERYLSELTALELQNGELKATLERSEPPAGRQQKPNVDDSRTPSEADLVSGSIGRRLQSAKRRVLPANSSAILAMFVIVAALGVLVVVGVGIWFGASQAVAVLVTVVLVVQLLLLFRLERLSGGSVARDQAMLSRQQAMSGQLGSEIGRAAKRAKAMQELQTRVSKALRTEMSAIEGRSEIRNRWMLTDLAARAKEDQLALSGQIQNVLNLFALADIQAPMPPARDTTWSPGALSVVLAHLLEEQPELVVECGSGSSTVWMALVARRCGIRTRIVSLESDDNQRDQTIALAQSQGVSDLVDVRKAPSTEVGVGDRLQPWCDPKTTDDLHDIGLFVVGRPRDTANSQERYSELTVLLGRMAADAIVVFNDADRLDEQGVLSTWLSANPGLVEELSPSEEGVAVLRIQETTED